MPLLLVLTLHRLAVGGIILVGMLVGAALGQLGWLEEQQKLENEQRVERARETDERNRRG